MEQGILPGRGHNHASFAAKSGEYKKLINTASHYFKQSRHYLPNIFS